MGDAAFLKKQRAESARAYDKAMKRLRKSHPEEMDELQKVNAGPRASRLAQRALRDNHLHEFKTIYAEEAIKHGIRPRSNRDSVYWRIARLRTEGGKRAVE